MIELFLKISGILGGVAAIGYFIDKIIVKPETKNVDLSFVKLERIDIKCKKKRTQIFWASERKLSEYLKDGWKKYIYRKGFRKYILRIDENINPLILIKRKQQAS